MSIKIRLTIMNFMQFFVWGSWLISLGGYMFSLGFSGMQIGSIYATMGIGSLFMPGLLGIVADKWINAERVLGICHIIGAGLLYWASQTTNYTTIYTVMLLNAFFYMPTIALTNTVSYSILERNKYDVVKAFPPIRVWGTIGFIIAMWVTDIVKIPSSDASHEFYYIGLYLGSFASLLLGIYAFTLPQCRPSKESKGGIVSALGLDAFVLFKNRKMAIFLIFSMLIGAALQITNTFGDPFLRDFETTFKGFFAVEHPGMLMSISQISETLFILTIPFFLHKFGIKKVMIMSMFAWVFRFGLFGLGDPGSGLYLLIGSMIIYGMAFDFFNISGSLFIETEADKSIRGSAQGLFMIMTNGIGAFIGGTASGWVVDHFTINGVKDWSTIWFVFSGYALILAIAFTIIFKYKHDPEAVKEIKH